MNNYNENDADNTSRKPYLDLGQAVINDSLFSEYMRHHGVVVNGKGRSRDFIVMKFDYGVKGGMSSKELRDYYYKNGASVTWPVCDKDGDIKRKDTILILIKHTAADIGHFHRLINTVSLASGQKLLGQSRAFNSLWQNIIINNVSFSVIVHKFKPLCNLSAACGRISTLRIQSIAAIITKNSRYYKLFLDFFAL